MRFNLANSYELSQTQTEARAVCSKIHDLSSGMRVNKAEDAVIIDTMQWSSKAAALCKRVSIATAAPPSHPDL